MQKTIIAGTVLAIGLCSGLLSREFSVEAKPEQKDVKVKTVAQAANRARLYYINEHRRIRHSGEPETIANWKKPDVTRSKSKQGNLLWNVHFVVPHGSRALPNDDFTVTMGENGKIVYILQDFDNLTFR